MSKRILCSVYTYYSIAIVLFPTMIVFVISSPIASSVLIRTQTIMMHKFLYSFLFVVGTTLTCVSAEWRGMKKGEKKINRKHHRHCNHSHHPSFHDTHELSNQ